MQLKTLDIQDNSKLLLYVAIVATAIANIVLGILALVFKDGIAVNVVNFYQWEVGLLIPASGLVSIVQHGISAFFASKQLSISSVAQGVATIATEVAKEASDVKLP